MGKSWHILPDVMLQYVSQKYKYICYFTQCGSILPCEVNHTTDRRGVKAGARKDPAMMVKKKTYTEKI